jgi:hypothetical protein
MITQRQEGIREKANRIQMMDKRGERMKYIWTNQFHFQAFRVNGTHCKHQRKIFVCHIYQGSGLRNNMHYLDKKKVGAFFQIPISLRARRLVAHEQIKSRYNKPLKMMLTAKFPTNFFPENGTKEEVHLCSKIEAGASC